MSRRLLVAWALVPVLGVSARAQVPFHRATIPTRTALGRVGLERQWSVVVPLQPGTERVIRISHAGNGINERVPAAVYHAPATAARFISNSALSTDDDFYVGATLEFTAGSLKGTGRLITGYAGKTHAFSFETPFPQAPAAGDEFQIRGYNEKIVGTVESAPATAARFMTDTPLAARDDYYVGATLVFTSGALQGVARDIAGYKAQGHVFEFADPFPQAPADGDGFAIRGGLIFAQTNRANLHAFDAESGQHLWVSNLGAPTLDARPVSVNSATAFVANSMILHALDRPSGRELFTIKLDNLPSSATAASEDQVMVGLVTGKLVGYLARDIPNPGDERAPVRRAGSFTWAWTTNGNLRSRPIFADRLIAFGSEDGKLYVAVNTPPSLLFRYLTGGPITAPLGTFGTRTILVPSGDNNVYAVDLYTADTRWNVPTGAPVIQEPLVAQPRAGEKDHDAYVVNAAGTLLSLDPETGTTRWTQSTGGGTFLAIGKDRIYLVTAYRDLFVVSRANGAILFSPRDTFERAGLNLRDYTVSLTNSHNDRVYVATPSGSLLCLREAGQFIPRELRDPKVPRFGVLPEGAAPAAAPAAAEAPPAEEKEKPAEEKPAETVPPPDEKPEKP